MRAPECFDQRLVERLLQPAAKTDAGPGDPAAALGLRSRPGDLLEVGAIRKLTAVELEAPLLLPQAGRLDQHPTGETQQARLVVGGRKITLREGVPVHYMIEARVVGDAIQWGCDFHQRWSTSFFGNQEMEDWFAGEPLDS